MPWITTENDKHINTDWFDKERQIADSKKEADSKNKEATYTDLSKGYNYQSTKDWFKQNSNYDAWSEHMEDDEIFDNVYKYTGDYYGEVNNYLRTGKYKQYEKYSDEEHAQEIIHDVDDSIKSFDLKSPITVYRASDSSLFGKSKMTYEEMQSLIGKEFTDKAYLSTSMLKELPGEQTVGGSIDYKIQVPAGKGIGAYIAQFSENSQEREFLINRNSRYKVISVVRDSNGRTQITLQMMR